MESGNRINKGFAESDFQIKSFFQREVRNDDIYHINGNFDAVGNF